MPAPPTKICDTPDSVHAYWHAHIPSHPFFNPDNECFVILLLSTRRHVKGHVFISNGSLDTLLVHPRETFKPAIVGSAAAIVAMHNHPSGDPTPSDADIKATRDLIKAGQLLKIDLTDHLIIGHPQNQPAYCSLRELGYWAGF